MRVYRRGDSGKWQADIKDQHGLRWRVPLLGDRGASEQVARQLERLVALHVSSGGATDPSMREWLRRLPPALYQRVMERGLVDMEADGIRVTVAEHLDAWAQYLRDGGRTPLQAEQQRMRAATLLEGCSRLADIVPARVQRNLEALRAERGWSQRTRNGYLKAGQQFERWLVKQGRAMHLGLTELDAVRVTLERERRALTPGEASRLLEHCQAAGTLSGRCWILTGQERHTLYLVALKTGLRANELRQLRRADVDLDAGMLAVRASVAKSRKARKVPLPADVLEALRVHCVRLHPGAPLWRLPAKLHHHLLKPDASACGIALVDEEGRHLDFHALRHTYGTWLDQHAGASGVTAQRMLGHADLRTTQRYMHAGSDSMRQAAERLPVLVVPMAATGTDDRGEKRATERAKLVARSGTGRDRAGNRNGPSVALEPFRTRPAGLEPATFGFVDRCDPVPPAPSAEAVSCSDSSASDAAAPCSRTHPVGCERATERAKVDADIARLVSLWPRLPGHARVGILAMAVAAAGVALKDGG
ncbi:MAG: site-specific integrase [Chloroflexi bacterium]|nr:site-specific integrase [Chloroflexota bacterium]